MIDAENDSYHPDWVKDAIFIKFFPRTVFWANPSRSRNRTAHALEPWERRLLLDGVKGAICWASLTLLDHLVNSYHAI